MIHALQMRLPDSNCRLSLHMIDRLGVEIVAVGFGSGRAVFNGYGSWYWVPESAEFP